MNKKTIEFSKSSLLSLKAEVLRKQQEVTNSRLNGAYIQTTPISKKILIKNPGVDSRNAKDEIEPVDEDVLTKSRLALEAKTKLYDKLSKSKDAAPDSTYLVQFDKKDDWSEHVEDQNQDPGQEWVEYMDYLGRSRTCLRKDLPVMQAQHKEMDVPEPEEVPTEEEIVNQYEKEKFQQCSEQLKEEWEKREEELANRNNVHYQDVLFNEARAHGVGYYNFSFDEEERAKQQANLKNLRNETKTKQQTIQEKRELRENQMAARAKAARNRKRARMGLPPETDEEIPKTDVESNEIIGPLPIEIDKIKVEQDKKQEKLRKEHVRPWDIGKEGVVPKTKPIQTQEQWINNKRNERIQEFAPPTREESPPSEPNSLYFTSKASNWKRYYESKETPDRNQTRNESSEPPPDSLYFTSKSSNWKRFDESKEPVNPYKRKAEEVPVYKKRNETVLEVIQNEVDEEKYDPFCESDDSGEEVSQKGQTQESWRDAGKYASIPPPPTFDYYGPSVTKSQKTKPDVTKIQASIEAGLKFLRKQSERKHAQTEHVGYFE